MPPADNYCVLACGQATPGTGVPGVGSDGAMPISAGILGSCGLRSKPSTLFKVAQTQYHP